MEPKFGISKVHIEQIAKGLYQLLANNYALLFATQSAHWNMEDERFLFLHKMLEDQYNMLFQAVDEIAERIRLMGVKVPVSLELFAKTSQFSHLPEDASADQMLRHLAEFHEKTILFLRKLSKEGEKANDYGLVDFLGGLLRNHEKTAWLIRSHL